MLKNFAIAAGISIYVLAGIIAFGHAVNQGYRYEAPAAAFMWPLYLSVQLQKNEDLE